MNQFMYDKYLDMAMRHGIASRNGDHKAANKAYKALMMVLKDMRAEPDRGTAVLSELLKVSDPFAACWAATHLLPLEESIAKAVLQLLAKDKTNLAAFNAEMVLREWDAGRLKIE